MTAEREKVESPFAEQPAPEPGSAVEEAMPASAPEGATRATYPTGESVDDHDEELASPFPGLDDEILESMPTQRMQPLPLSGATPDTAAEPPPAEQPALPTVRLCPMPVEKPKGSPTVTLTVIPSISLPVSRPPPLPQLEFFEPGSDHDLGPIVIDGTDPGGGLLSERPTATRIAAVRPAVIRPTRGRLRARWILPVLLSLLLAVAFAWCLMVGLRLGSPVPAVRPPSMVLRQPPVQPTAVPVIAAPAKPAMEAEPAPQTEPPEPSKPVEPSSRAARVGNPEFIQGARGWLVRVPMSATVRVKVFELQKPLRIVVDLFKATYPGGGRAFKTPIPFISRFRVAQRKGFTRVVLDVNVAAVLPYHTLMLPSGLSIQFDR